ncbi:MAG: hypothetical protein GXN92_01490 [Candidatus Micrarchaeota archaeon]|nr:hypothetical protein [Candidatus Micrarchaeota archaeon]
MDNKMKLVLALVAVLVLGELAYILFLAPSPTHTPFGKIEQQTLQVPYRVVGYGDRLVFEGEYQPWMQEYVKNYYQENSTVLVIVDKERLLEFYNRLKEEGYEPLVLIYLVDEAGLNHSYSGYLPLVPINSTVVLEGVYLLQDGRVVNTGMLQPVITREVVTVPYKVNKILENRYKYVIPFEERIKYQNYSNICVNVTSQVKQPYVTYLGPDYIVVNESFTNITRILEDYPGAICLPTVIVTDEPLNITGANVTQVYEAILVPLEPGYPEIVTEIPSLNQTQYNITMEVAKSGNAVISYIILE